MSATISYLYFEIVARIFMAISICRCLFVLSLIDINMNMFLAIRRSIHANISIRMVHIRISLINIRVKFVLMLVLV